MAEKFVDVRPPGRVWSRIEARPRWGQTSRRARWVAFVLAQPGFGRQRVGRRTAGRADHQSTSAQGPDAHLGAGGRRQRRARGGGSAEERFAASENGQTVESHERHGAELWVIGPDGKTALIGSSTTRVRRKSCWWVWKNKLRTAWCLRSQKSRRADPPGAPTGPVMCKA